MLFRVTKLPSTPLVTYVGLFTFGTPACSTPWQRVGGSINPLQTLSLVYNQLIIWVEIDDTTLPYGYRFCFGFFAVFTPCRLHSLTTGWGSIIALWTCLLLGELPIHLYCHIWLHRLLQSSTSSPFPNCMQVHAFLVLMFSMLVKFFNASITHSLLVK